MANGGCWICAISAAMSSAWPLAQAAPEDAREQDVLAALDRVGVDPEQRQQAGRDRADLIAHGLRVGAIGGRRERAEHRDGQAGVAAGRVDREVGGVAQALDARAVLAPVCEALGPHLGLRLGEVVGRGAGLGGVVLVDPGPEVLRAQRREGEHEIGQVALGVDHDRRHAVERGLLDDADAEPRLARARHADADGVRGQVLRVVEDVAVLQRLGLDVVRLAEVEAPKSFDLVHGASLRSVPGKSRRCRTPEATGRYPALHGHHELRQRHRPHRIDPRRGGGGPPRSRVHHDRAGPPPPTRPRLRRPRRQGQRPADARPAFTAEPVLARPPRRHRLRLDPARRPGHRALRRRVVREEPRLLRSRGHHQARDRGRVQRRGLDARRARGLRAQVRAPHPVHREAQPQRVPELPERLRPDHVRSGAPGARDGRGGRRRDDLLRVARVQAPDRGGLGGLRGGPRATAWPRSSGATCATRPSTAPRTAGPTTTSPPT